MERGVLEDYIIIGNIVLTESGILGKAFLSGNPPTYKRGARASLRGARAVAAVPPLDNTNLAPPTRTVTALHVPVLASTAKETARRLRPRTISCKRPSFTVSAR